MDIKISKRRKMDRPFLSLCLSMAAVGISAEMVHTTNGRFSMEGNIVLQLIPIGILLYGLLEHFSPDFCRRHRSQIPLVLSAYCIGMMTIRILPVYIFLSAVFGVIVGILVGASLVSFLESGITQRRWLNIGIAVGIYSVSVYPFDIGYKFFEKYFPKTPILIAGYLILIALLFLAYFHWPAIKKSSLEPSKTETFFTSHRNMIMLLIGMALLICMNQVMNSGTLEKQGGTESVIWLYLVNVALRIPLGAFLGHLMDHRPRIVNMAIPIAIMVAGCLASLFLQGTFVGDAMVYLLLNLGGKGCVFLVSIICMFAAVRRVNKGLIAGLGLCFHFFSVGYLNLYAIGLSPVYFGTFIQYPLSLAIILFSTALFLFMIFLSNPKPYDQLEVVPLSDIIKNYGITSREAEVLRLLIDGKSTDEIAETMAITKNSVQNYISSLFAKTGIRSRTGLIAKFSRAKP